MPEYKTIGGYINTDPYAKDAIEGDEIDPRDRDPSKRPPFDYHNCYRCKDGALPCVKGAGNERDCETLHARND